MVEYKVILFSDTYRRADERFLEEINQEINNKAREGWRLKTVAVVRYDTLFVFLEREINKEEELKEKKEELILASTDPI